MSRFQDIVGARCGRAVSVGEIVTLAVDNIYVQDGNAPTMARLLAQLGAHRDDIKLIPTVVFDHSTVAPTGAIANQMQVARDCSTSYGFRVVREGAGISHIYAAEQGLYQPDAIVLGSDSHTCAGGAFQCLSLGMGISDILHAMITGLTWVKVPRTVQVRVSGRLAPGVAVKDLALYLLSHLSFDKLVYCSIEFIGDTIRAMSLDAAQTLSSMAVEFGAKCCFLDRDPCPELPTVRPLRPEAGDIVLDIDAASVPYMICGPDSLDHIATLDALSGRRIDMCFLGSCTNGRLEDFAAFADALGDDGVADGLICQATPGSQAIYRSLIHTGILERLIAAGVVVTPPGCGPCAGVQGHIPHDGAAVLSTMNRNFKGRMGNRNASIYLCSPRVLAVAARLGRLPTTQEVCDAL